MLLALFLIAAEPDLVAPTVGAAIGASSTVLIGSGLLAGASVANDDAAAVTLGLLGIGLVGSGSVGAAIGAAIASWDYHPLDVAVAAGCGALVGTVVGVGGGFAAWALTMPDEPLGIIFPIAGALVFETGGAATVTALMVLNVE